jgi:hypothetical protein
MLKKAFCPTKKSSDLFIKTLEKKGGVVYELDLYELIPSLRAVHEFLEESIYGKTTPDQDLNEKGAYFHFGDIKDSIALYLHNKYPNAYFLILSRCPIVDITVWKQADVENLFLINDEFFKNVKEYQEEAPQLAGVAS